MSDQQHSMSVRVLCLDGGGIRGLSSLLILKNIFQRLSNQYSPPKSLRPCDVFDIICGTSTGGIAALMLGRLRMSVDEAIDAYLDFSKTVFEKKRATDHPMYDASKLEEWVKKIVSEKTKENCTSLSDESPPRCRTFVVAVRQSHGDSLPKVLRTYEANGTPADDCEIWEAARATTTAFPFFEPVTLDTPRNTYMDSQFSGSNNPSQLAVEEVESLFPSRKIGCLLSLGTGKLEDVASIPQDEHRIAEACVKIIESCEITHDETFTDFERRLGGEYIRLSVDRGLGQIGLDEWAHVQDLTGITEGYLRRLEVEAQVTKCIEVLKETNGMVFESPHELSVAPVPLPSETESNRDLRNEGTQHDVPPVPLSLDIEFIPDRQDEEYPREGSPVPRSLDIEFIPDRQDEEYPREGFPVPRSLDIEFIPDRQDEEYPREGPRPILNGYRVYS